MKPDRAEILRYMKMGAASPSPELAARIDKVERAIVAAAAPRIFIRCERIERRGTDADGKALFDFGGLALASNDLARVLKDCDEAYLIVATLGSGVDQVQRRLAVLSGLDALIAQATGASLIESFLDEEQAKLGATTPRFSPGYGDLALANQRAFLAFMDSSRTVGVTLTDRLLMAPSKSVTAIAGARK